MNDTRLFADVIAPSPLTTLDKGKRYLFGLFLHTRTFFEPCVLINQTFLIVLRS